MNKHVDFQYLFKLVDAHLTSFNSYKFKWTRMPEKFKSVIEPMILSSK